MNWLLNGLASFFCVCGNYIIVLVFLLNMAIIWLMIRDINKIKNFLINRNRSLKITVQWTKGMIEEKNDLRNRIEMLYIWFTNITAVFPLLGIAGTVAALVKYSSETMMDNFMVALGTTLFGVIAAVVCKILDALLVNRMNAQLDSFDEIYEEYFEAYQEEKRVASETEKKKK